MAVMLMEPPYPLLYAYRFKIRSHHSSGNRRIINLHNRFQILNYCILYAVSLPIHPKYPPSCGINIRYSDYTPSRSYYAAVLQFQ